MKLCVMIMLLNFLQTTEYIWTSIFRASMKVVMVMSFLLTSVGEISPEGELFVHSGKAVTLFTNITVDRYQEEDRVVSLYINGITNQRLIAVWVLERIIEIKWLDDYYAEKTFMDANQNIWIYNVDKKDAGLYAIKYGILTNFAGPEVKLTVLDELTEEEQVQRWMDDHPEFKKKYSSRSLSTRWVFHVAIFFSVIYTAIIVVVLTTLAIRVLQWIHVARVKARKSEAVLQKAHHVAEVKAEKIEAEREHKSDQKLTRYNSFGITKGHLIGLSNEGTTQRTQERENDQMLEEIERNFKSERKVKNILLVGLPSAGKSSLINSLACLVLGKYIPIASVRQGVELTNTCEEHRYPHFGITEEHLRGSPNERTARIIYQHLPNLTDFVGFENTSSDKFLSRLMLGTRKTDLFENLRKYQPLSSYQYFIEDMVTDFIIFVHSVTTREVPYHLIHFLLNIIRKRNILRPVVLDFYVVLTKMDKVESGEVTEEIVNAIENAFAKFFDCQDFMEYKLFKLTNWCDDVGFPNFTTYNLDGRDKQSVALNNQLLKLLQKISTPKAVMTKI